MDGVHTCCCCSCHLCVLVRNASVMSQNTNQNTDNGMLHNDISLLLSSLQCTGFVRGIIEHNITAVAHGNRTKESVLQEAVDFFKADFISASQRTGTVVPHCTPVTLTPTQT